MPSQQAIDRFTLAFHRQAVARLRADDALCLQALQVLDRWERGGLDASGQSYRDQWRGLLRGDVQALEQAVCTDTSLAATLRGMSPLGFVLDDEERLRIRREAFAAEAAV